MKKTIGWILLVISLINGLAIPLKLSSGLSIGSPLYLIILVMMFFGGISLISSNSKNDDSQNTKEIEKYEND